MYTTSIYAVYLDFHYLLYTWNGPIWNIIIIVNLSILSFLKNDEKSPVESETSLILKFVKLILTVKYLLLKLSKLLLNYEIYNFKAAYKYYTCMQNNVNQNYV